MFQRFKESALRSLALSTPIVAVLDGCALGAYWIFQASVYQNSEAKRLIRANNCWGDEVAICPNDPSLENWINNKAIQYANEHATADVGANWAYFVGAYVVLVTSITLSNGLKGAASYSRDVKRAKALEPKAELQNLYDKSLSQEPIPDEYIDPVFQIIMDDPLKSDCGHVFDRETIDKLPIKIFPNPHSENLACKECPMCRAPIRNPIADNELKKEIETWVMTHCPIKSDIKIEKEEINKTHCIDRFTQCVMGFFHRSHQNSLYQNEDIDLEQGLLRMRPMGSHETSPLLFVFSLRVYVILSN